MSLVVSVLTLFSMAKIWNGVFWGVTEHPTAGSPRVARRRLPVPVVMTSATIALVGVTLGIALFAGPIYELCHRAAEGLLHPTAYVDAVLGR